METRSNHVLVGSVMLILLAMLVLFSIWIARVSAKQDKVYDILFHQSVDGVNKGSQVSYSGVPVGQVKDIQLWRDDPQFVRVRISVTPETPILEGTSATVQGSFTGTSTIQLNGGKKGAPPIACPAEHPELDCPAGAPLIPPKPGGFGAILANAPQLLDRLSTLTERLTELLNDRNQVSIGHILANTDRLTEALADRSGDIGQTLTETRVAIQKAGAAADQIAALAQTANGKLAEVDLQTTMGNLNKAIASAQQSMATLDDVLKEAKPGVSNFSRSTLPEVGRLVHDLREVTGNLNELSTRFGSGGATGLLGRERLPDYKGK
jgi:phospholipid/cholesterol/gamma-HCH transport system substrate-binding protein